MMIVLIVSVAVLLTLMISLLNTRRTSPEELRSNGEIADKYLMIVTAIYGIFLAFIITNLWTVNDTAIELVNSEASDIVYSAMLTSGLDPVHRQQVIAHLSDYTGNVIQREWPIMQRAKGAKEILRYGPYEILWEEVIALPAHDVEARDIRNRLLDSVHQIGDMRRKRLLLSEDRLTIFFKVTIIAGAIATIIPITYLRASRWRFQVVGSLCTVGLLTMMVCLIFDLSWEYAGITQIRNDPLQTAFQKLGDIARDPRLQGPPQAVSPVPAAASPSKPAHVP